MKKQQAEERKGRRREGNNDCRFQRIEHFSARRLIRKIPSKDLFFLHIDGCVSSTEEKKWKKKNERRLKDRKHP